MTKGKQTLTKDGLSQSGHNQGLYQQEYEHDACGVGMVVNIHGGKCHELVDNALKVLENTAVPRRATRRATVPAS